MFISTLENWAGRKIGTALKKESCGDEAANLKICLGKAENTFLQIGLTAADFSQQFKVGTRQRFSFAPVAPT